MGLLKKYNRSKFPPEELNIYKEIYNHSNEAIAIMDASAKYIAQNPAHKELYGYSDKELIGKTPAIILGDKQFESVFTSLKESSNFKGDVITKTRSGKELSINTSIFPIKNSSEMPEYFVCFNKDLSERSRLNTIIRETEENYRKLVENSIQGIVIMQDFKFVYTNKAFAGMTGYSVEELLAFSGSEFRKLAMKEDRQKILNNFKRRLAGEDVPAHYQFKLISKNKQIKYLELYAQKITYNNKPAVQGFILDITGRKKALQALEEGENKYKLLVENTSDLIIKVDSNWKIQFVNPQYCNLFGKTENQLIGDTFSPVIHEDDRKRTRDALEHLKTEPFSCYFEQRAMTVKGWRWIAWSEKAILDENGKLVSVVGFGRDIQEIKQADEILSERTKLIETILKHLPIGISVNEIDSGRITLFNNKLKEIFGWSEVDLPTINSVFEKVFSDEEQRTELANELLKNIANKYSANIYWNDIKIVSKNGRSKIITMIMMPLYKQNLIISAIMDITEQQVANEKLQKSLAEKEILLREIHHRVKNNLQTIMSLIDLQTDYISDPEIIGIFKSSQSRIRTMALIHERLYKSKDLSRIKAGEYLQNLLEYLTSTYFIDDKNIEIETNVSDISMNLDLAIPCGLIINELVSNSIRHAFPSTVKSKIIEIILTEKDPENLLLSVKDSGIGIPATIDFKNASTLGLQLINLLSKQIDAQIDIVNNDGTQVVLVFPKPVYLTNKS